MDAIQELPPISKGEWQANDVAVVWQLIDGKPIKPIATAEAVRGQTEKQEALANAVLMAAAPELFMACAAALESLRNPEVGNDTADEQGPARLEEQLEAALMKALGVGKES